MVQLCMHNLLQILFPYRFLQNKVWFPVLNSSTLLSTFYTVVYVCYSQTPLSLPHISPLVIISVLYVCGFIFVLYINSLFFFLISNISNIIRYLSSPAWLTSPSMIITTTIHVAANDIISFCMPK
ncbi:unnamed protein product [Rangifer tarandus platyrhynchus]|uniref:Uncharacterized protein n=1 Tax=Rangifer tarandus platyrhynchus TaxID=3082113 RepID=A0AC59Y0E2_RANTA